MEEKVFLNLLINCHGILYELIFLEENQVVAYPSQVIFVETTSCSLGVACVLLKGIGLLMFLYPSNVNMELRMLIVCILNLYVVE